MVLKLYGTYKSPFVRLVATVLIEKQVPFELVSVDFVTSQQKSPEYLLKNPFGQVPFIVRLLNFFVSRLLFNTFLLILGLD